MALSRERKICRRPAPAFAPALDGVHPVLVRVYAARGIVSLAELECASARLLAPQGLAGIDSAVALLADALERGERILIVADFDADGATSCALAVRALRALGASDVRYLVPNRFEYGYGLTPEIVAVAARERPALLVTVDNGVSSVEGVAAARAAGMRVLVTDHHLPGERLPAADAIVNPNQVGDVFASKHLAGVGVIFYVMLALRAHLRDRGWFSRRAIAEPNLATLTDLVALGTVADVVPLDHNNRILVAQGLARINAGRACEGVRALLEVAGRAPGHLRAADLAFAVAPRLNAAGRVRDMSLGIACLLADDRDDARRMALDLDRLNQERRRIEETMQDQALSALAALEGAELTDAAGVCLFDERWHPGVVGIVAGRLKDRLHRPVIAFAPGAGDEIRGSARSIAAVHVRDVLDAVAARHPGLVSKFGGHAAAAGVSLPRARFEAFRAAFAAEVARVADADALQGRLWCDDALAAGESDLALAEAIAAGGPWGQAFPEPLFEGRFEVLERRVLKDKHLRLRLRPLDGRAPLDAIAFHCADLAQVQARAIHAAYRLDVNDFQGLRSVQLVIEHLVSLG